MKNEKEILLNPEEIQLLLEGGLFWKDIEPKLWSENPDSSARQLATEEYTDSEVLEEPVEEKDVRAILFGEDVVVKNRQIDLSHIQEEAPKVFVPEVAATEDSDLSLNYQEEKPADTGFIGSREEIEVGVEEKNSFLSMDSDDSENILLSDEIEPQDKPFLSGWKLLVVMGVVAVLTFGFWYYFLSR